MFGIIICSILASDVIFWLWADRKARRTKQPLRWRVFAAVWSGLLLGYLVWFMLFPTAGRHAHTWMPIWALAVIYVWHLFVLPAAVICIGAESAIRAARWCWNRFRQRPRMAIRGLASDAASEVVAPSRRQLLSAALIATPPIVTAFSVGCSLRQLHQFRTRRIEIALPTLPPELDGMTIAHVSDTHVGRFTRPRWLPGIADAVNQLRADLVLFTGDLIDLTISDLPASIDFLRQLDPRSGLFLCEGNHDLIEDPDAFEFGVRRAGFDLLLDESRIVRVRDMPVQVTGLTWRRGDRGIAESMNTLTPQLRGDCFPILLAHHPHAFDVAASAGIPLTLSGHTHGGQLMLSERLGAGPVMFRYWTGLYRRGNSALSVSNGIGNWLPLRINAPAELVHVTLRRG